MGERKQRDGHNQAEAETESNIVTKSSLTCCAVVALCSIAIPVWAQQSHIYRDGNSWVEEMTGRFQRRVSCTFSPILVRWKCRVIRRGSRTRFRKRSYALPGVGASAV